MDKATLDRTADESTNYFLRLVLRSSFFSLEDILHRRSKC